MDVPLSVVGTNSVDSGVVNSTGEVEVVVYSGVVDSTEEVEGGVEVLLSVAENVIVGCAVDDKDSLEADDIVVSVDILVSAI